MFTQTFVWLSQQTGGLRWICMPMKSIREDEYAGINRCFGNHCFFGSFCSLLSAQYAFRSIAGTNKIAERDIEHQP